MRRLVVALVLANLLVFGWNRGWFDGGGDLSSREENAERLRPVPLSRLEPPVNARTERTGVAQPTAPGAPAGPSSLDSGTTG